MGLVHQMWGVRQASCPTPVEPVSGHGNATHYALKWLKQGKSPYQPHPSLGPGRPRRSFDVPDEILSDIPVRGDIEKAIESVSQTDVPDE